MFLPLGAVGGPFALPNYYLRMSTDQTLCASFTPSCHKLSIVHPSQHYCPPNCPPTLYFNKLFRPNHKSYLSYYYVLVLFVFPCLIDRRVAWNSTSRCWTFETLESISNQSRIDLRLSQINLKSISNQSRIDVKSVSSRSRIDLRLIMNRS